MVSVLNRSLWNFIEKRIRSMRVRRSDWSTLPCREIEILVCWVTQSRKEVKTRFSCNKMISAEACWPRQRIRPETILIKKSIRRCRVVPLTDATLPLITISVLWERVQRGYGIPFNTLLLMKVLFWESQANESISKTKIKGKRIEQSTWQRWKNQTKCNKTVQTRW